jgi:hypothetical protein
MYFIKNKITLCGIIKVFYDFLKHKLGSLQVYAPALRLVKMSVDIQLTNGETFKYRYRQLC